MKRIVSMVLTAVMLLCIMPVVFAAGNAVSVASTSSTYIGHLTNGTTLVDISTGNVVTEGGAVLSVAAEAPEACVFTATTGGQEYEYSLLDEREVNGKKEYFILANNAYGAPGTSWVLADNTFNYGAENNLATLLNDSFYDTGLTDSLALDTTMKKYIVENAWLTEGNHNSSNPVTQFDYTSTCKIAVLSEHEYIKYSNKIGSQVKDASGTVINNSSWYLRTARASKTDGTAPNNNIRYVVASNGNTNGDNYIQNSTKGLRFQIRPCFWISEDYFKNVALTTVGAQVADVLLETEGASNLYDDIRWAKLHGIVAFEEDAETLTVGNTMDSSVWRGAANNTVVTFTDALGNDNNKAIQIQSGKSLGYIFEEAPSGLVSVEFDGYNTKDILYSGVIQTGEGLVESHAPIRFYPAKIYNDATNKDNVHYYAMNYDSSGSARGYRELDDSTSLIPCDIGWNHYRYTMDLSTGEVYAEINGIPAGVITADYLTEKDLTHIVFAHMAAHADYVEEGYDNTAYVDNIKIVIDKNRVTETAIQETSACNSQIQVSLDSIADGSSATMGVADITVNSMGSNNMVSGTSVTVLDTTTPYEAIVYGLKLSGTDIVLPTITTSFTNIIKQFTVTSAITDAKFAKGETAVANVVFTPGNSENKNIQLIFAAYQGDVLVGAVVDSFIIDANKETETHKTIELLLESDASHIEVFVWDDDLVPYNDSVWTAKESTKN